MLMARQKVKGHKRRIEGKLRKVKFYIRKKRPSKGKKRIVSKKLIRFKPRRAVRDEYGQIIDYK